MNVKKLMIIILLVLLTVSCSTTRVTSTWIDSSYEEGALKKIAVVGVFRNTATRKEYEDAVSKTISSKSGTKAVPSLSIMAPGVKYEYNNMEKTFNDMGIDAVLIIRTKSIDKQSRYVPGKSYIVTTAHPMYYYDFPYYYKYYRYTYETIREPGYYTETYIASVESTLFRNSDDKMIWMMEKSTTENYKTIDGITNPKKEAARSAELIVNDLMLNGLVLER